VLHDQPQAVSFLRRNRLLERIREVGLWSTLMYLVLTVLPERVGVEFTALYRLSVEVPADVPEGVEVYLLEEQLPARTRHELTAGGGEPIREQIGYGFGRGYILAVGYHDDRAASLAWLSRMRRGAASMKPGDWAIHSCLTFAHARGRHLYSKSIAALTSAAYLQSCAKEPMHVYIESSVANKASILGIERCGFRKVAYLLRVRDRVVFSNDLLSKKMTLGIRT
jgi:hypothetical protein